MLQRATSPLPPETEELVFKIIGCAIEVHTRLGAGYVEAVYHKAMCIELQHQASHSKGNIALKFATAIA